MLYTLRFFSSICSLYHNANFFGSCIIHILYTGCAEIKKKSGAKGLIIMGGGVGGEMEGQCDEMQPEFYEIWYSSADI